MLVYKITNEINGKVYIGITEKTLEERWNGHKSKMRNGNKSHLYCAMRKYGVQNFSIIIIEDNVKTYEELLEKEIFYISKFNSTNVDIGYNMTYGGDTNPMIHPRTIQKHKERLSDVEVRSKISNSLKEYRKIHPFSEEHRKRLSESSMGNHNFGSGDTRSIGCYCILSDGTTIDFHSYRDAWKWWKEQDNPFNTQSECVYQRKIKQSIDLGYYTYGHSKTKYEYPKWFKKGGDVK